MPRLKYKKSDANLPPVKFFILGFVKEFSTDDYLTQVRKLYGRILVSERRF